MLSKFYTCQLNRLFNSPPEGGKSGRETRPWSAPGRALNLSTRIVMLKTGTAGFLPFGHRYMPPEGARRNPATLSGWRRQAWLCLLKVRIGLHQKGLGVSRRIYAESRRQARRRHTPPPRSRSPKGEDSGGADKPPEREARRGKARQERRDARASTETACIAFS